MSEPYSAAPPPPLLFPPSPPLPPSMWLSSSYGFKCTMIGDVLGAESGDYMMDQVMLMKTEQPPEEGNSMAVQNKLMRKEREKQKMNREIIIPPPITLLRRMHWGFKRECSADSRLIIRAERVRLQEQVESHRQNGRLTMNLIPEDDDDDEIEYCEKCGYPMEEEEEEAEVVLEDLEFNEETEELDCEKEEEEEEEDNGFEFEGEMGKEEEEEEGELRCRDLRECGGVAYGGSVQDLGSYWDGPNGYIGRPASASSPLRPITFVM